MSNSNSALTRVPVEIWGIILLEVIHVPYLLDTTCVGSFFLLWDAIDSAKERSSQLEWQIRLLCLVCKSWKHFVDTKLYRYRSIGFQDGQLDPHILANAQRAQLCLPLGHMLTVPTRWEVVEIDDSDMVDEFLVSIRQGYHPRLRRLTLCLNQWTKQLFLSAARDSVVFYHLTFLHLRFPWGSRMQLPTTTMVQVALPRLEVLIWDDYDGLLPSQMFRLPTLRHLGWGKRDDRFPVSTLLSYAPTLHSLSIRGGSNLERTLVLPDLNKFPYLEELSINIPFEIKDPNLVPPTYPLHTINIVHLDSTTIDGVKQILLCNPVKLRRIQSGLLQWGRGGLPSYPYEIMRNCEEVVGFAECCQDRGIRMEDSRGRLRSEVPPTV